MGIAVGIGILISMGNFGVIKIFSLGAPQSSFSPLFYVTLIVYGVIVGLIIWHEKVNALQIFGILLACIGIFMATYFKR